MLGLQETRAAGTPSSKTYSCVACSATFQGLASLLVHQASHANEISDQKVATLPTCSHCGSLFATEELLEKHHCMVLPPPATQDVYICDDCGEQFHEFSVIQEHKKLHETKTQLNPPLGKTSNSEETLGIDHSYSVPVKVPLHENSPSPCPDESLQLDTHTIEKKECLSTVDIPLVHNTILKEHHDEGLQSSELASPLTPTEIQDKSFKNESDNLESENISTSDTEESPNESKESTAKNNKSLLKMLASAYMNQRQTAQKLEQSRRTLPPRKVSPRAPVQTPAVMSALGSGYYVNQLREKMAKNAPKIERLRQASNTLNVKPGKKKKRKRIVSTTKTLYPVIALETCQKLVRNNIEGKHQCGICRRVFQDVDSLIMHHALHKKERVKFCRRCKKYVICVISVPNNHICYGFNVGTNKHSSFVRKTLTSNRPNVLHPKLFHCKLCNRSYTRRHRLNTHNCQQIASPSSGAQKGNKADCFEEGSNAEKQLLAVEQDSSGKADFGMTTEKRWLVKTEELNDNFPLEENDQTKLMTNPPSRSAKSFPPYLANISKFRSAQSRKNINSVESIVAQDKVKPTDREASGSLEGGQWTEPLDDAEVDVMIDVEEKYGEAPKKNSDMVVVDPIIKCQTSLPMSSKDFQVHISETGVKRFSCNRCQRTYSRCFTVKQHLKICGARKFMEHHSFGKANILALKKNFPCPSCGTSFTRKDNMKLHHKRCQSMRNTNFLERNKMVERRNQPSNENMFVLPPVSKSPVRQESSNNTGGGNWGIMSLPSVLPRKVTCECGAGFTCPRLLFEHLQLHAMESYICSHCGENLQSWADFEVHQKLHVQTSSQKSEQKGSQQQQPHGQSPLQQRPHIQTSEQHLKKQPQDFLKSHLNHRPLTEPCVCHRCKKTFGGRKSLLRHLRLSCRGDVAVQKKLSCSRCSMTFQSPLSYKVHVQSNTCTPSFKPIRCPVCVRWFSCLNGLKRHLVSHSRQNILSCQICGYKCSGSETLEEHKRMSHGTKEASESPTIQSAHVSQSNPSNAFRCQICHRSYIKLQSLKDHLRKVHRPKGLKPVNVEPKTGAFQSSLGTVQQNQHRQFQCHICSRAYPNIQSLKNHKRRVHRMLGRGLQASNANVQQSHSSPFQCHICSRSYPDLRSFRNHRRRVHRILGGLEMFMGIHYQSQENQFRCNICQRSYPDVKSLKNHRRRVHRILGDVPESAKASTSDNEKSEIKLEVIDAQPPSAAFEAAAQ